MPGLQVPFMWILNPEFDLYVIQGSVSENYRNLDTDVHIYHVTIRL